MRDYSKININKEVFESGKVHFCGIGGVGMSAIAFVMNKNGIQVQGSDNSDQKSYTIKSLLDVGIKVFPEHKESNVENDVSCVVYSTAINLITNPEILEAQKRNIPIVHRSVALGYIMQRYKSIVVTGSHGKTTTTSLVGYIMDKCGFDPMIVSGGIMNMYNLNTRIGNGNYIVVEGDESDGSLLNYPSDVSLITNIDREHIDHYGSMEKIKEIFANVIDRSKESICCSDDLFLGDIINSENRWKKIIKYGTKDSDFTASSIEITKDYTFFEIFNKKDVYQIKTKLFGEHNVKNITGAFALCKSIGCDVGKMISAISQFSGVKRRFTKVGTFNNAIVIDDYAHHPTEIKATLSAIKNFMHSSNINGRLVVVFQPHRFTRVFDLIDDFGKCFGLCDDLILTPIYAASEINIQNISSYDIMEKVKLNMNIPVEISSLDGIKNFLKIKNLSDRDLVVFMGAGDISKYAYLTCDVLF